MSLGVPTYGKIPQEYPLGSTMSGRNTAVPSSSHTGGFAGRVFIPKPDPQLSRVSVHCSGIPSMDLLPQPEPSLHPKPCLFRGIFPPARGNMGRSCSHTFLDNTKKHFWRPHSIAVFFSSRERTCRSCEKHAGWKVLCSLLLTALIQGGNS